MAAARGKLAGAFVPAGVQPETSCRRARRPMNTGTAYASLPRLVRSRGLEPPRVAPLAPQASASTNSATTACGVGAPDRRPCTQAADVTARLRPDKAARGGPVHGAGPRPPASSATAPSALFFAYGHMNPAQLTLPTMDQAANIRGDATA